MKIILEFNDDETQQAEQSYRGPQYALAVGDFREYLRQKRKYGDYDPTTRKEVEEIEQAFHDTFEGLIE